MISFCLLCLALCLVLYGHMALGLMALVLAALAFLKA